MPSPLAGEGDEALDRRQFARRRDIADPFGRRAARWLRKAAASRRQRRAILGPLARADDWRWRDRRARYAGCGGASGRGNRPHCSSRRRWLMPPPGLRDQFAEQRIEQRHARAVTPTRAPLLPGKAEPFVQQELVGIDEPIGRDAEPRRRCARGRCLRRAAGPSAAPRSPVRCGAKRALLVHAVCRCARPRRASSRASCDAPWPSRRAGRARPGRSRHNPVAPVGEVVAALGAGPGVVADFVGRQAGGLGHLAGELEQVGGGSSSSGVKAPCRTIGGEARAGLDGQLVERQMPGAESQRARQLRLPMLGGLAGARVDQVEADPRSKRRLRRFERGQPLVDIMRRPRNRSVASSSACSPSDTRLTPAPRQSRRSAPPRPTRDWPPA